MTTRLVCFLRTFAILGIAPLLTQCGITKHVPKPNIDLPFGLLDKSDAPIPNDPFVPYDLRDKLKPGHTLELSIYRGTRSPDRVFNGKVLINEEGIADFGKLGTVRLAGLEAPTALRAISSMVNTKLGDRVITIHLFNIEDLPVITVNGAVKNPGVVRWFGSANTSNILGQVNGRTGNGRAVYISRDGQRYFHTSQQAADAISSLKAGDIVTYTEDL